MEHDLQEVGTPRRGSQRRTTGFLILFAGLMLAADLVLLHRLGWSVIFWGKDRSRVTALAFTMLIVGAFVLCQQGISVTMKDRHARMGLIAGLAGFAALSLFTAFGVLEQFPNSGDEYAYWFGAETYLAGRLWNMAPPLGQVLASNYTWVAGAKWAGQYPPGWPATLAAATGLGLSPWVVGTVLTGGTMLGLSALIRRRAGRTGALLAVLAFAAAPFTIFTAASLHAHTLAAALSVGVMVAFSRVRISQSLAWPLLTGILIGALGVTRSVTAAIVLMPILASLAWRRDVRSAILLGVGGVPFVLLLLWYQGSITGDPLKPVYWLSGRNVDHLYFDVPSIRIGLAQTLNRLAGLSLWTAPVLPLVWLYALVCKIRRSTVDVADFVFPLGVLVFIFYPLHMGNGYGPRYYYDFWPLMMYTIGSSLVDLGPARRRIFEATLALSVIYCVLIWPVLAMDFHRITQERRDLYDQAAARNLRQAVICMRSGTSATLEFPLSDLARNGVTADSPVLYARCDAVSPDVVAAAFPNRTLWVYDRDPTTVKGRLTRIR